LRCWFLVFRALPDLVIFAIVLYLWLDLNYRKLDKVCFLCFCMSEGDNLRDVGVDEEDYEDLPRIVIEDDRIVVLDDDWIENNAKKKFEDRILGDEDIEKLLEEGVIFSPLSDSGKQNLEESVGGSLNEIESVNSYEPKKSPDFYGLDFYGDGSEKEYDPFVGVDVKDLVNVEEERNKDRSMLEIAGFKDFEAEEKRKRAREDFI